LLQNQNVNADVLSGVNASGGFYTNGETSTFGALTAPTGLTPSVAGSNVYYVVTALNAAGIETTGSVEQAGGASGNLTFNVVAGAASYKVYRGTTSGGEAGYIGVSGLASSTTITLSNSATTALTGTSVPPTSTAGTAVNIQGWNGQSSPILYVTSANGNSVQVAGNGNLNLTASLGVGLTNDGLAKVEVTTAGTALRLNETSTYPIAQFLNNGNVVSGINNTGNFYLQSSGTGAVTLATQTQSNALTINVPTDTSASDTLCLLTLQNCGAGVSSTNSILNQYATTQTGNFNIQSASTTAVTATIQGLAGQTGNLLSIVNSSGVGQVTVGSNGYTTFLNSVGIGVAAASSTVKLSVASGLATVANFTSASATSKVLTLNGAVSQTGDLQDFDDTNNDVLTKFDANGNLNSYGTYTNLSALISPNSPSVTTTGTAYYYAVAAYNAQGSALPGTATGANSNNQTITWTQVNGATGYYVYRSTTNVR
jgi:hypothetical protein